MSDETPSEVKVTEEMPQGDRTQFSVMYCSYLAGPKNLETRRWGPTPRDDPIETRHSPCVSNFLAVGQTVRGPKDFVHVRPRPFGMGRG